MDPSEQKGTDQRRYVKINDEVEMVIPDTYEKEKWETKKVKEKQKERVVEIKVDESDVVKKELSPTERIDIKYGNLNETLVSMKDEHKNFDKFVRMINRRQA